MAEAQYKMSSYAKFLLGLACELRKEDVAAMKLVLAAENKLACERSDKIQTAAEMFVHLQHIGLLGPRNVSFFEEVFPSIGRGDLLPVTSSFKGLWDTPSEIPVQNSDFSPIEEKDLGAEGETAMSISDDQSHRGSTNHLSQSRTGSLSDDEKMEVVKMKGNPAQKPKRRSSKVSLARVLNKLRR